MTGKPLRECGVLPMFQVDWQHETEREEKGRCGPSLPLCVRVCVRAWVEEGLWLDGEMGREKIQ